MSTADEPISLLPCIPAIATSLAQPGSGFCMTVLIEILGQIRSQDYWEHEMRQDFPSVIDQIITFLFTPRSPDQLVALESTLNDCQHIHSQSYPTEADKFHHVVHQNTPQSDLKLDDLLGQMYIFIDAVFSSLSILEDPRLWPTSNDTAVIFPMGTKEAVLTALDWYSRSRDLDSLMSLVHLCRTLPPDNALPQAIFDCPSLIQSVASQLEEKMSIVEGFRQRTDVTTEEKNETFLLVLKIGIFLTELVLAVGYSRYRQLHEYMQPAIAHVVSRVMSTFRTASTTGVAYVICMWFMCVEPLLDGILPDSKRSPYEDLFEALVPINKCSRIDCPKNTSETVAPLHKCTNCRLVSYCSEQCQQRASLWSPAPHRDMCADVEKFMTIKETSGSKDEFVKMVKDAGFKPEQCRYLHTAIVLVPSMVKLTQGRQQ